MGEGKAKTKIWREVETNAAICVCVWKGERKGEKEHNREEGVMTDITQSGCREVSERERENSVCVGVQEQDWESDKR